MLYLLCGQADVESVSERLGLVGAGVAEADAAAAAVALSPPDQFGVMDFPDFSRDAVEWHANDVDAAMGAAIVDHVSSDGAQGFVHLAGHNYTHSLCPPIEDMCESIYGNGRPENNEDSAESAENGVSPNQHCAINARAAKSELGIFSQPQPFLDPRLAAKYISTTTNVPWSENLSSLSSLPDFFQEPFLDPLLAFSPSTTVSIYAETLLQVPQDTPLAATVLDPAMSLQLVPAADYAYRSVEKTSERPLEESFEDYLEEPSLQEKYLATLFETAPSCPSYHDENNAVFSPAHEGAPTAIHSNNHNSNGGARPTIKWATPLTTGLKMPIQQTSGPETWRTNGHVDSSSDLSDVALSSLMYGITQESWDSFVLGFSMDTAGDAANVGEASPPREGTSRRRTVARVIVGPAQTQTIQMCEETESEVEEEDELMDDSATLTPTMAATMSPALIQAHAETVARTIRDSFSDLSDVQTRIAFEVNKLLCEAPKQDGLGQAPASVFLDNVPAPVEQNAVVVDAQAPSAVPENPPTTTGIVLVAPSTVTATVAVARSTDNRRSRNRVAKPKTKPRRPKKIKKQFDYSGFTVPYTVVTSPVLRNLARQLSLDDGKYREKLIRLDESQKDCVIKRTRYLRSNLDCLNKAHPDMLYEQNPFFNLKQPYQQQFTRMERHPETGKPDMETRCALCCFCKELHFYELKNSCYSQHMSHLHGIFTDDYLTPEPMDIGIYLLAKKDSPKRKTHPRDRHHDGVVCPACYELVEVRCWSSTQKLKPLSNYLRHFKECHRVDKKRDAFYRDSVEGPAPPKEYDDPEDQK